MGATVACTQCGAIHADRCTCGWQPAANHDASCRGSIRLGTACVEWERCVREWIHRHEALRSDLLAALMECHDYDSLYARGMELLDEYDPVRPAPPEKPE